MATSYYFLLLLFIAVSASLQANCNLSKHYYRSSCPQALSIVQARVIATVKNETRTAASLLGLHFHDCFVNGCDGSLLLDDAASFNSEKTAVPNYNSSRGFNVVDYIKANLEKACPGVVSCAEIPAIAACDSVVHVSSKYSLDEKLVVSPLYAPISWQMQLGDPSWKVRLGRRDYTTASRAAAHTSIHQLPV